MFEALQFSISESKEEIVYLNTEIQLFEKGINSENVKLTEIGGEYAPYTVFVKKAEGLPFEWVTLFDTGKFYESFKVLAEEKFFTITANTEKKGWDFRNRWGDEILGLTEESKNSLVEYLQPFVVKYALSKLLS